MTSHNPSNEPTEEIIAQLDDIRVDTSWPIDPDLVESFRRSIQRGEPPLLNLSLNRIWRPDGTFVLEVIDGWHRLEALRLEGVERFGATVREYSPHAAYYARIATSIGKPYELFRQRAEQALREGFLRDVADHLDGVTLYQRGLADDGTPQLKPRRAKLPSEPLLALGTILWIHFAAKTDVSEEWERFVLSWLEDVAARLGKSIAWLRDEVLDITALIGDDLPGKRTAERARLLLAIPDDGILRLVLARLRVENKLTDTDLRCALDMLGCGPDVARHAWLKRHSLAEMRSILASATLMQLAQDFNDALARAEQAARIAHLVVRDPASPAAAQGPGLAPSGDETLEDKSQVFGTVSSKFAHTDVHSGVPEDTDTPVDDPYSQVHSLSRLLIRAWQRFGEQGGDWSRPDVQEDLSQLRAHLETYLSHTSPASARPDRRRSRPQVTERGAQ